jgi:glycine cleavage system H protein
MSSQYRVPDNLAYTREHEWAKALEGMVRIGITDYAAKTLNDVVYVSMPSIGQTVEQSASFGTVESIKAVSELYSPLSGTVTKVNTELSNHPELVNKSPYEEGWIIEIKPSRIDEEKKKLLDSKQYQELLSSLGKQ